MFSGKYDIIQEPVNISEMAKKNIPFYMFVDEETDSYLKNTSSYTGDNKRVGLWRIIVVHNVPYSDARRNGKVIRSLYELLLYVINRNCQTDKNFVLFTDSEASIA